MPLKRKFTNSPVKATVKKKSRIILSRAFHKPGSTNNRIKLHVKRGDEVVVISGKDKGKVAKILEVFQNGKVIVEGVNIKTKHKKPFGPGQEGEITPVERPIYASKVMLWDAKANKGTRVRIKQEGDRKVRVSVASGEILD